MKKKLFLAMMAIVAVFATLSFSACSSDDDDNNNGGGSGASSNKVIPKVAIAEDMLNLFDVTITVNGKTVALTNGNTKTESLKYAVLGQTFTKTVRTCSLDAVVLSESAPSMQVTVEAKFKSGVNLAEQPNSDYLLAPLAVVSNSSSAVFGTEMIDYKSGVNWKEVAENQRQSSYEKGAVLTLEQKGAGFSVSVKTKH